MAWQYTPFTLPLALAAVISVATFLYVVRRAKHRLHSRLVVVYLLLAIGAIVWTTGYALQLSSTTLQGKLFWNDIVWLGIVLVAINWVLFAFDYAGVERVFRRHWLSLIVAVPVVTLLAAWTNSFHGLLMGDPYLETTTGGLLVFAFDPGPLFLVHLLVTFSLDLATYATLAWGWRRSSGRERTEFAVLLGVGILPFLGAVSALIGVWPVRWVDPTPVLFVFTSVAFAWVIVRHQLFNLVPAARRTVLEDLPDGIVVTDGSRRVVDANRTAEAVLGGDGGSILGTTIGSSDDSPPDLDDAFDSPGTEVSVETTIDGEPWVYDLRVDTVGDGYVGVLRDRTEASRAQHRFQTLIERSDTLIAIVDADSRIEYASPAYQTVLSLDPAELEGTVGFDIVHPEDREEAVREFLTVIEEDEPRQVTVRVRSGDGEWRDVEFVAQSMLDDPTINGLVIWGQDVTEQRRYQQRLRVLNRVLRHDLRNDMNVVGGYASMLADHDDPEVTRMADIIDRKVADLLDLSEKARTVEDSLSASSQRETVDLVPIVAEQADSLASTWPDVAMHLDLPDRAIVDAHPLITSAVDNVLENAIEHGGGENSTVEVHMQKRTHRGMEFYDLVVADNGPGIPDSERAVIESGHESSLAHSSGIGLWLVNWVVSQSGGEFDVVDTGEGAAVRLRLPAVAVQFDESPATVANEDGISGV